jgi:hypothetical protein
MAPRWGTEVDGGWIDSRQLDVSNGTQRHPAGLVVRLDARSRGDRVRLRLEDLDITRTRAAWADQMIAIAGRTVHVDDIYRRSSAQSR